MYVQELNAAQLDSLRWAMFYEDGSDEVLQGIETPFDISNEMVFSHYDGIYFVEDDFA